MALGPRRRGFNVFELMAVIAVAGLIALAAAPNYLRTKASGKPTVASLAASLSSATQLNYLAFARGGSTADRISIEQCDPTGLAVLSGGDVARAAPDGGSLIVNGATYSLSTAARGDAKAGGVSLCVIADATGRDAAVFRVYNCPGDGTCAAARSVSPGGDRDAGPSAAPLR